MINETLILRQASSYDIEMISLWRNSPHARKYSFNTAEISWDNHQKWFRDTLQRKDRIIMIGELADTPIGVLRFELMKDEAEVSIYLDPNLYGKGLGTKLLQVGSEWLRANLPHIKRMTAKILQENIASKKAFLKAGFEEFYNIYHYDI